VAIFAGLLGLLPALRIDNPLPHSVQVVLGDNLHDQAKR
jgi:hypothetical protein